MNFMIGIVIVTYHSSRYLQDCLESLRGEVKWDQICIIDNASSEDLSHVLKHFPGIHFIENSTNRGFATAANQGIRYFLEKKMEAILLLNPDTKVRTGAIKHMLTTMNTHPACMVVQPLITLMKKENKINTWGNEYKGFGLVSLGGYRQQVPQKIQDRQIEYASGACMLVHSEAFQKFGLLNEYFFLYFEDTEFSQRVRSGGGEIWLAAQARVGHDHAFPVHPKKLFHFLRSWHRFSSISGDVLS